MYEILARLNKVEARSDGYGIDHDMWIRVNIVDGENTTTLTIHNPCPIPLERYRQLIQVPANQRVALYKALIIEFWNTGVVVPQSPSSPTNLSNLTQLDDWADAVEAFNTQKASDIADCATLAGQARTWIESLPGFTSWEAGFDFTLQT